MKSAGLPDKQTISTGNLDLIETYSLIFFQVLFLTNSVGIPRHISSIILMKNEEQIT